MSTLGDRPKAEPQASLWETDFARAAKFGGDTKKPREIAALVPVTAMTYNVFDQSFVDDGIQREMALVREVSATYLFGLQRRRKLLGRRNSRPHRQW